MYDQSVEMCKIKHVVDNRVHQSKLCRQFVIFNSSYVGFHRADTVSARPGEGIVLGTATGKESFDR